MLLAKHTKIYTYYCFDHIAKKLGVSINIKKKKSCSSHNLSRPESSIVGKALVPVDKFGYDGHLCLKTLWWIKKSHRVNTNEASEIERSYLKEDPIQNKTKNVLYSSDFHFLCS